MKNDGNSLRSDIGHILCGMLMGGADVIPGVSGGTVALIVGIYQRLITAISHFDTQLMQLLRQRRWIDAVVHIDLRFLISVGLGIAIGVVSLGGVMNRLLTTGSTRSITLAAFFGLILASTLLVARLVKDRNRSKLPLLFVLGILGAAFAFWVTGLPQNEVTPSSGYVFVCGVIAISAMILPGISGAYLMLVFGLYIYMTDILKRLPKADVTASELWTVFVFLCGCAIGIITFSKVLRILFARFHDPTLAVLCGFMVGALRKVWPFQRDLTPSIEKLKHKEFENIWPDAFDQQFITCLTAAAAAGVIVFAIHWVANRRSAAVVKNS